MTENNGLPKSWTTATLGKICDIQTGKKDVNEGNPEGKYLFYTCAAEPTYSDVYSFEGESILLPGNGANVGMAFYYTGKFEAYQRTYVLNNFSISGKYVLYYFLGKWRKHVHGKQFGTATNYIRLGNLTSFTLPIPPLPEQERIVAKIEELFTQLEAGAAELEQAKTQLQRYRQAVLKSAVEGELTREWREAHQSELEPAETLLARILSERRVKWEAEELAKLRAKGKEPKNDKWKAKYKEPALPNTDGLPELPEGWVWGTLEQLAWNASYGTSQKCNYEADGPPVIRIPNINNGRLKFDDLKFATKPSELSDDKAIVPHDLLIIRTNGSIDLIGRSALVRNKPNISFYFASYLIRYRLLKTSNFSSWISLIWDSHFVRNWMVVQAATTAGQYNVSVSKLNRLIIPLPPVNEQKRIIAMAERRLSVADEIEKELDQALARSERLRQSILKRAFDGRLVEQEDSEGKKQISTERKS